MPLGGYALAPGPEWTALAATWPVRAVSRETEQGHWLTDVVRNGHPPVAQVHLDCGMCGQSVTCLIPDLSTLGYLLNLADIQARVLAHIRQSHDEAVT